MNNKTVAELVRICKQQVRLATRGLDVNGLLELYLAEIPIQPTARKSARGNRAGRAGFFHGLGPGDVGRIVINVGVCYTEQRFTEVLYHELAHAICHWVHADKADCHGPLWKGIMEQLGQKPERCHSYQDRK